MNFAKRAQANRVPIEFPPIEFSRSLGEVGAGARVDTPGWETFAKLLFDRMHYGVDTNVAALALVLLAGISLTLVAGFSVRNLVRH